MSRAIFLFLWWELTLKTRDDYNIKIRNYLNHCVTHCNEFSFLVTMSKLIDWLSHLNIKRIIYEIVKKYICEIKSHHVNLNYFFQKNEILHTHYYNAFAKMSNVVKVKQKDENVAQLLKTFCLKCWQNWILISQTMSIYMQHFAWHLQTFFE